MKSKPVKRAEMPEVPADAFRLEDFLPYRLSVTANLVTRMMARRYAEAYGLSIPEWRVLAMVGRFGTLSPGAVGEWTAMDKVKVSRASTSLVARGLLKQTADPDDGRGRLLRLTRKGAAVLQGMVPLAHELEERLSGGLSRTEWNSLLKTLSKLNSHVQAVAGPDHGASVDC